MYATRLWADRLKIPPAVLATLLAVLFLRITKLDAKLEKMNSRDAFSKTTDHGAKARKVASDQHAQLQRELQMLRKERGIVRGDKSFDSAWQHRGVKSPRAGDATLASPAGLGSHDDSSTSEKSRVRFQSPRAAA